jgi:hypothetical protein
MNTPADNSRVLNRIIVVGLSMAFSALIASLETLRPAPSGFAFEFSWKTLASFAVGLAVVVPCFRAIVYSQSKPRRFSALIVVGLIGIASFFYPLRFVPREKYSAIFGGLALAAVALCIVVALLLMARRFFEKDS